MSDIDKVMEAEKNIQDLAVELKRLRDGAQLLERTEQEVRSVLNASEAVVMSTDKLTKGCGQIIDKLGSVDLLNKLEELKNKNEQVLKEGLDELSNKLKELFGKNDQLFKKLTKSIFVLFTINLLGIGLVVSLLLISLKK